TADGAIGMAITPFGLLAGYMVRKAGAKLTGDHKLGSEPELIEGINKIKLNRIRNSLSKSTPKQDGFILKRFNTLSINGRVDLIWVQSLKGDGIVYANKLTGLYRVYLLGDGRLVELVGDAAAIDELPKQNRYIIIISSGEAEAVSFASNFESGSVETLFELIWEHVDEQRKQRAELIIIRMKDK
ncbi:MAG: hypothetical protein JST10_05455, partial [Bacteroidetes bacterium]|nr:hypothetical protein [Bacteroidota bacterium]